MHASSVIKVQESVASSLAMNEGVGNEENTTILDFKGNISAITVERVSLSVITYNLLNIFSCILKNGLNLLQREGRYFNVKSGSEGAFIPYIISHILLPIVLLYTGIITSSKSGTEGITASIQLPGSLFNTPNVTASEVGDGLGLVFSFFATSALFPLPNETDSNFEIRSSVIGALLAGVPVVAGLSDPIMITLQLHIDMVGLFLSHDNSN